MGIRLPIRKPVIATCFFLIVYYAIMEVYYFYFVGLYYEKFQIFLDVNVAKYIETKFIFVFLLVCAVAVASVSEFVFAIYVFFFTLFTVPTLVTYSFSDQIPGPLYCTVMLMLGIAVISVQRVSIPEVRGNRFSHPLIIFFLLAAWLPVVYTFGFHLNIDNLFLANVFETREQFYGSASSLMNYFYNWLIKAIIPIALVYFLIQKKYIYSLIPLFILFYLYIISGNKIVFITLFVVIFFFKLGGDDYVKKTVGFLKLIIAGLLILPLIDAYILHSHAFKGLFAMRTLYLPSHLNYLYFDLFEGKPLYFAESNFFKWLVDYPFDRPVGYVISERYFNAPDMNSNNGIISDGYMNMGYPGVALNILMVSLIFMFFNSLNIDPRYFGIFFLMIFLFLGVPMLSMFITSGLWIIVIMSLTFMRRPSHQLY